MRDIETDAARESKNERPLAMSAQVIDERIPRGEKVSEGLSGRRAGGCPKTRRCIRCPRGSTQNRFKNAAAELQIRSTTAETSASIKSIRAFGETGVRRNRRCDHERRVSYRYTESRIMLTAPNAADNSAHGSNRVPSFAR